MYTNIKVQLKRIILLEDNFEDSSGAIIDRMLRTLRLLIIYHQIYRSLPLNTLL